nr:MAG TPA: hypothetical protein [Caudoviricetes sp.]
MTSEASDRNGGFSFAEKRPKRAIDQLAKLLS